MDLMEAIRDRHSVRQYEKRSIEPDVKKELEDYIAACNAEGGMHIQLVTDEPKAFDSMLAHYGQFSGVTNYLAVVGPKGAGLEEKCGYYGEKVVLKAQQLGLNTCWVAGTYKKIPSAFTVEEGEKFVLVIAIGYGVHQGKQHQSKTFDDVTKLSGEAPEWFKQGVEAALLAPTAINQQKFTFSFEEKNEGNKVLAKAGLGFNSKIDLGIVKYHFEIGAGKENFVWE
ncbi:MAG: nitroreductase [Acetatifactor sp.]|nr:nitroreductase [Acetatifactor sp.]